MTRCLKKVYAFIIVSVYISIMISGCSSSKSHAIISIDNVDFHLGCKVSEIVNAGFQIGESDHIRSVYYMGLPEIDARTTDIYDYFIFKDFVPSHVGIGVYNPSDQSVGLEDCIVYKFSYNCGDYLDANIESVDVRLNKTSFQFSDKKQVIESLELQGYKFEENSKADFMTMSEEGSKYLNALQESAECKVVIYDIYDSKTNTRLIDGFEISIKQD